MARDPDAIQREIEQTRAELADTIDAIADRVSPKRAAARGSQAVKAQVSSVLHHSDNGSGPLLADGSSEQRRLRPERVAIAVGAVIVIAVGIGFWRRHRR